MRKSIVVLAWMAAAFGCVPGALGQSYTTNVGAAFFYGGASTQFVSGATSGAFPLLGLSTCSCNAISSPSSGQEHFVASVDRGLIEHTSFGAGSRGPLNNLPGRFDGFSFGGSGTSSASWNDVVVSYVGGDVGSDVIAVSASFSMIGLTFSNGTNVTPVRYTVNGSASIAGTGGSASFAVQNSSGSATVAVPSVFVTVNQPFTVSMSLATLRNSGVAFGGQYASAPGGATWNFNASIATNGPSFTDNPVFNVPEGYTVNSAQMGVVNNAWQGRTVFPPCSNADIGSAGGLGGPDGQLDNNDFIVFIDRFFASSPTVDIGRQGGVDGSDGHFDNNDFIVYIDRYFVGCGA